MAHVDMTIESGYFFGIFANLSSKAQSGPIKKRQ